MLLLFFPSNAFMAFARPLHTFNCSKKMNCELKALWCCYSCCTDRLRPGMDLLAPWTVKESAYCALRQGSARAVSSACTISLSWWSTAMVSGGTVGEPPPLHLWVAGPRSGSSTRLPNLSWSSVAASAGGCWDQLWPARLKVRQAFWHGYLSETPALVVVYGSTSWSFSIAIAKSTGMVVRRDEQCQVQSSSWNLATSPASFLYSASITWWYCVAVGSCSERTLISSVGRRG